jgi:hypothetical protein
VVCGIDRDERRLRDLVGGTPSLIEEVHVVRRNADQAAHVPSTEVVPNVPLSHRGTPRSSHRRGVTSGVRGTYVIGVASGAGLEGKDERFDALLLRCGKASPTTRARGPSGSMAYGCWPMTTSERTRLGACSPIPKAEPPAPGDTDEVR